MPSGNVIRSRLRGTTDEILAEINITPLCDVLLVLLIIFMLTASFISQSSIKISTPKATVGEPPPASPIVVSIDRSGVIYLGNQAILSASIFGRLKELKSGEKADRIIVRADKAASYESVFWVINAAKALGFTSIALSAEMEARSSP